MQIQPGKAAWDKVWKKLDKSGPLFQSDPIKNHTSGVVDLFGTSQSLALVPKHQFFGVPHHQNASFLVRGRLPHPVANI